MTTTMIEKGSPSQSVYAFTALDRCDATCTGQAYHRAVRDGVDFFFCNHHYEKHKNALTFAGYDVETDVKALQDLGVKHYVYSEQ